MGSIHNVSYFDVIRSTYIIEMYVFCKENVNIYRNRLSEHYNSDKNGKGHSHPDYYRTIRKEWNDAIYAKTRELISADDEFWKNSHQDSGIYHRLVKEFDESCFEHYDINLTATPQYIFNEKLLDELIERTTPYFYTGEWLRVALSQWKPLIHLEGKYNQYNDILFYDPELRLLILYAPDDNYYHWNNYDKSVIKPPKGNVLDYMHFGEIDISKYPLDKKAYDRWKDEVNHPVFDRSFVEPDEI